MGGGWFGLTYGLLVGYWYGRTTGPVSLMGFRVRTGDCGYLLPRRRGHEKAKKSMLWRLFTVVPGEVLRAHARSTIGGQSRLT